MGRWPGIRKPGNLPAYEMSRANGVFRDRLLDCPSCFPCWPSPSAATERDEMAEIVVTICTTCRAGQATDA